MLLSQRTRPEIGAALSDIVAGDLVFDPQRRGITERTEGWQLSQAPLGALRVEVTPPSSPDRGNTSVVTVYQGARALRPIALPAGRDLTAYAVVPRPAPAGPLLAVATHQFGQPLLELFDATTGAVVRELSGHVAAIEHLALSDDGRLLASTAGDRTVCIWNLADLDSIVGARAHWRASYFSRRVNRSWWPILRRRAPIADNWPSAIVWLAGFARAHRADRVADRFLSASFTSQAR